MSADKVQDAWEEICEAIDHVARANWPGRDIDAREMAHKAFEKALAAVREDEREQVVARSKALRDALRPFAHFWQQWTRQPMNNMADTIYAIHTGTEYEAEITWTDCRRAYEAIRDA